jgi:hypothetical protein
MEKLFLFTAVTLTFPSWFSPDLKFLLLKLIHFSTTVGCSWSRSISLASSCPRVSWSRGAVLGLISESHMEEPSFPCSFLISQSKLLFLLVLASVPRFLSAHRFVFPQALTLLSWDSPSCFGSSLFFLHNIFFGSTSCSPEFIHRSRKIFPPVLRSAVPFFPAEKFRFCRRFFSACDSPLRCPGWLCRSASFVS